ncbi:diguanylate cyclase (GGDEF) domain-containing protein [Micromonospora echinofusca]|uniref:Diguanylate cyclase (GGDEF) domain-containing protein n=1 Tax=Micromonospora echinofusca TaxID=47858 RepID=A0A1C5G7G0_MICEH|nr:GGDEF domain-containing protein [Micromonospora echinofusca]SCG14986.1 diguanylate cyclase (GGDEF) domain-containing protein [Micromonospora echinofusca]
MSDALVSGLLLVAGLAVICWDQYRLSAVRYELAALRRAAARDPLTGLANRAGLAQAWAQLAPVQPWAVVVDLDGFKPVNDTHGHAAGDVVLTAIAARLRSVHGVAARLGGDEFAALICDPQPVTAARWLAQAIAAPVRLPSGAVVSVTASIGLAPTNDDLAAALADADAAMYRAKTTRCGVAVYQPHRDDHTIPTADPRPLVRTRDLPTTPVEVTR